MFVVAREGAAYVNVMKENNALEEKEEAAKKAATKSLKEGEKKEKISVVMDAGD